MRTCWRVAGLVVVGFVALWPGLGGIAAAQSPEVEGAADFRGASRITDGTFTDNVTTGESVWYGLLYTNDTPYRISAKLKQAPPEGSDFSVELIAPSLKSLDESDEVLQGTATYGGAETNLWFVKVNLPTTGQVGQASEFELSIAGANDGREEACDQLPDCTAPREVPDAQADNDEAKRELDELKALGGEDAAVKQIDDLKAELATLQEQAEPKPSTPTLLVVVLVLVGIAAAVGGLVVSRRRGGGNPRSDEQVPAASTTSGGPSDD